MLVVSVGELAAKPTRVCRLVNALLRAGVPVVRICEGEYVGGFAFNPTNLDPERLSAAFRLRIVRVNVEVVKGYRLRYPRVGVYSGRGTHVEGRVHADTLRKLGFYRQLWLGDSDVYSGLEQVDVLLVPGGWGLRGPDFIPFGGEGRAVVRRFVENGGGYLGTCAGAVYLGKRITAADLEPGLTLGLLDADVVACFRGRGLVGVRATAEHPLVYGLPRVFPLYHGGGFVLKPRPGGNATVVAVFESLYKYEAYPWALPEQLEELLGSPNMVVGEVGKGRVVALSSHPEFQSHLRIGSVKFRSEGKVYSLTEDDVKTGYIVEANAIFYLASSGPEEFSESDLRATAVRAVIISECASVSRLSDLVRLCCSEAVKLSEAVDRLPKGYTSPFVSDIRDVFTLEKPPTWLLERYSELPSIAGYAEQLARASGRAPIPRHLVSVAEEALRVAVAQLKYLNSLVAGVHEALQLMRSAGDPEEVRRVKEEVGKCRQRGLMGRAAELEAKLPRAAWHDPVKWERVARVYAEALDRELFTYLVDFNRRVLGSLAAVLYAVEEYSDDDKLEASKKG